MANFYYGLCLNLAEVVALYQERGLALANDNLPEPATLEQFVDVYGGNLGQLDVWPLDKDHIYVGVTTSRESLPRLLTDWSLFSARIQAELVGLLKDNPDQAHLTKLADSRFEKLAFYALPL